MCAPPLGMQGSNARVVLSPQLRVRRTIDRRRGSRAYIRTCNTYATHARTSACTHRCATPCVCGARAGMYALGASIRRGIGCGCGARPVVRQRMHHPAPRTSHTSHMLNIMCNAARSPLALSLASRLPLRVPRARRPRFCGFRCLPASFLPFVHHSAKGSSLVQFHPVVC
jgi:hypothetical protein